MCSKCFDVYWHNYERAKQSIIYVIVMYTTLQVLVSTVVKQNGEKRATTAATQTEEQLVHV